MTQKGTPKLQEDAFKTKAAQFFGAVPKLP